ncbi:MAG: hypothetical protein KDD64_08425 [Bdellovibrionales bacterium]|nr:hypothetical protein [Bdellovibrionales bacterium]
MVRLRVAGKLSAFSLFIFFLVNAPQVLLADNLYTEFELGITRKVACFQESDSLSGRLILESPNRVTDLSRRKVRRLVRRFRTKLRELRSQFLLRTSPTTPKIRYRYRASRTLMRSFVERSLTCQRTATALNCLNALERDSVVSGVAGETLRIPLPLDARCASVLDATLNEEPIFGAVVLEQGALFYQSYSTDVTTDSFSVRYLSRALIPTTLSREVTYFLNLQSGDREESVDDESKETTNEPESTPTQTPESSPTPLPTPSETPSPTPSPTPFPTPTPPPTLCANPDDFVQLPSLNESPYASQHGLTRCGDLNILPANYQAGSSIMVGVGLSFRGAITAENPYGWNVDFKQRGLLTEGFWALNFLMERLETMNMKEVWFWGWAGQHVADSEIELASMPWYLNDLHTPAMKATWPAFRDYWKGRGFSFGLYLGSVNHPNFGTSTNPNHRYLKRSDYPFIVDTVQRIADDGFSGVGLDAFVLIMSLLDCPDYNIPNCGATWTPGPNGPRDPGLALDLLTTLKENPNLSHLKFLTESRVPYGYHLQAASNLSVIAPPSLQGQSVWPTADEVLPTPLEHLINPGSEIIQLIGLSGWHSVDEVAHALNVVFSLGHRPMLDYLALRETGIIIPP